MTISTVKYPTTLCVAILAFSIHQPACAQTADNSDASQAVGDWTPLTGDFSDTFDRWVPVPNGTSGAPRQGWLNTADGFFTREAHLAYDYVDGNGFNSHEGIARFNYPITRRLWIGTELPFYRSVNAGPFHTDGVGDGTITTQFMITEKRNVSINAGVGWRIPWGDSQVGGGVFSAQPQVNLWTDLGRGFSLRGRVAYTFPNSGVAESFNLNGTIGQTVTPHSKAPFGDLTWYIAGNWSKPTNGGISQISITPGMRTHVGHNLFFLAGVEIPLNRAENFYRERLIFQLVQGF